jgi:hypothetical protein
MVEIELSLREENPMKNMLISCDYIEIITDKTEQEAFLNESFCSLNPQGGIAIPAGKNKRRELKIALVKMCSRKNLYVGVEGLLTMNSIDISLLNFSNSNITNELFASNIDSSMKVTVFSINILQIKLNFERF